MSELDKAFERWDRGHYTAVDHDTIFDAARRFASLTSPETIEKAAAVIAKYNPGPVDDRMIAEAVLRSVEESDV